MKQLELPSFICDMMLGRLAKWLRLLGYDTTYFQLVDDFDLIKIALAEGRTLLTRDSLLMARKPVKNGQVSAVFIRPDNYIGQLRQVFDELKLTTDLAARCSVCNSEIKEITKDKIKDRVPPYVFKSETDFSYCEGCDRIYWPATHWRQISALKNELGDGKTS